MGGTDDGIIWRYRDRAAGRTDGMFMHLCTHGTDGGVLAETLDGHLSDIHLESFFCPEMSIF